MTKEEMSDEVRAELNVLLAHSKMLSETLNLLSKTALNTGDINFAALSEAKRLLDEMPDTNVKASMKKIQKALVARAKARIVELSK